MYVQSVYVYVYVAWAACVWSRTYEFLRKKKFIFEVLISKRNMHVIKK